MSLKDALGPQLSGHRLKTSSAIVGAFYGLVVAGTGVVIMSVAPVVGPALIGLGLLGGTAAFAGRRLGKGVQVHERGISVGRRLMLWDDVEQWQLHYRDDEYDDDDRHIVLQGVGRELSIPEDVTDLEALIEEIRKRTGKDPIGIDHRA